METLGNVTVTFLLLALVVAVAIILIRERKYQQQISRFLEVKNTFEKQIFSKENMHKFQLTELNNQHILDLKDQEKQIRKNSTITQRSVIKGKTHEQLAPLLKPFSEKYDLTDARFLGNPVDYLVFKGMSEFNNGDGQNTELEIVMLDIKTGNSNLSKIQKAIRTAIEKGSVRFELIRLD